MKKVALFLWFFYSIIITSFGQIQLTTNGIINTVCNGSGCNYSGPSILINEVMLSPLAGDGSIYGTGPGFSVGDNEGEWIELYNPNQCEPVDISCYFLGNNTNDGSTYGGGFSIPQGTIVPAQGFVVVRGILAPAVPPALLVQNGGKTIEIVVNSRVCLGGGSRLWFPNSGGWFAFYDQNGVPQDGISWATQSNSCMSCNPCNPLMGDCGFPGTLPTYDQIPAGQKNYIASYISAGVSYRRIPDGGPWAYDIGASPTYGNCNSTCNPLPTITCNGKAYVTVTGGVPPYTYRWDDPQFQTTDTAVGLCAGEYCVLVTDQIGNTATACYIVHNYEPTVTHPDVGLCKATETIALQGGSPSGGTYSGNGISGNQFAIPGDSAFYTATYTYSNANGCENLDIFRVHVYPQPVFTYTIPDTICEGTPADFFLYSQSNDSLVYSLEVNGITQLTGILTPNGSSHHQLTPSTTTNYLLRVYTLNNCEEDTSFTIRVIPLPPLNLGNDTLICENDFAPFELNASNQYDYYLWNDLSTDSTMNVNQAGSYFVTVGSLLGCETSDTLTVIIPDDPNIQISFSDTICKGDDAELVVSSIANSQLVTMDIIQNGVVIRRVDNIQPNGVSNYYLNPTVTTEYHLQFYMHPQCVFDTTITIFVHVLPSLNLGNDTIICEPDFIPFELDASSDYDHFLWHDNSTNQTLTVTGEGDYSVVVSNDFGCELRDEMNVHILLPPCYCEIYAYNVFTPNGDQINDFFVIETSEDIYFYELDIYDRWGKRVFHTDDKKEFWDGMILGAQATDGVYFYTVLYKCSIDVNPDEIHKYHSSVTIIR